MRPRLLLAAILVAAVVLPGCASTQQQPVIDAAAQFGRLASEDPAAACALLAESTRAELVTSEQKPCPEALGEVSLDPPGAVSSVAVFELQAQVVRSDSTTFLTLERGRWLVMAAGCRPRNDDRPYDCELKQG